ncbi:helix-turn-helix domain-containing protein [Jongsikchunia kroppenstedtii]|uniref:helix-turn-helix domain-containing protein n=1 Tax=Jongsikchunia kroppenstedtii TaxID=1121721 RepID=UPI00035D1FDE|nr:helix-turn-helix domain-containing protein [Jongsikchunia kroppenstedtii]
MIEQTLEPHLVSTQTSAMEQLIAQARRRCVHDRMSPDVARPTPGAADAGNSRLRDIAAALLAERSADIAWTRGVVVLTDSDGVVIDSCGDSPAVGELLERIGCRVGMSMAETDAGASSFSTLVTGQPMYACGADHFATCMQPLASAGTAIRHPQTRRVVGSLHLLTDAIDGNPMALSWITELVRELERELADAAARPERMLMERYLRENRDSRHAVVAISGQTIVTNAAAARLVGIEEQLVLWDRARELTAAQRETESRIEVGRGRTMQVRFVPVFDGTSVVGMILRLRRVTRTGVQRAEPLSGLIGAGAAWRDLCDNVADLSGSSMLLVGEPGVGKTTIATCLGGTAPVVDAADAHPGGLSDWLTRVQDHIDAVPATLVLAHADLVPPAIAPALATLLGDAMQRTRVIATSRVAPHRGPGADEILGLFPATVVVPPLRDRFEDLAAIVRELTRRYVSAHPERDGVQWMTDALQALSRGDYPRNLTSLQQLVFGVLQSTTASYIGLRDLPTGAVIGASRKRLVGLDRVEAAALLQALRDARGNKRKAADALGIARSTLYRKMSALGIDFDTATA